MPTWIDFKELRSKLKMEGVLSHYKVEITRRGEQHTGVCPLPGHSGDKGAQSFSVNLERGIFQCFGCKAKGNVLDFAVLMEGEATDDGRAVKKIAAQLRAKFCPDDAKENGRKPADVGPAKPTSNQLKMEVVANAPLDFELQGLDREHPYFASRGIVKETVALFGLGYCGRGLLSGRVAIPLHDSAGRLIGYAGRAIGDEAFTEANPKYKLPTKRERGGKTFEFRKSDFLYNGFRIKNPCVDIVVVSGFSSVWWLTQNGWGNVVSTMGPEMSPEQARLIVNAVSPSGNVWIMPDGSDAGEAFADCLLRELSPHRFVRWAKLGKGERPTDLSAHDLKACLEC